MTRPPSKTSPFRVAWVGLLGALCTAACVGDVGTVPHPGAGNGMAGSFPTTPVLTGTGGATTPGPVATGAGGADPGGAQRGGMAGTGGTGAGSTGTGATVGAAGTGAAGTGMTSTGGSGSGGLAGAAGTGAGATGLAGSGAAGTLGRGGSSGRTGSVDAGARDGGSSDGPAPGDAGSAPTFTALYADLFVAYCSGSQCHNPGTQHGVSFSSKSNAYSAVSSETVAGKAASSPIYTIISQRRMPPGGSVPADKLAELAAWINAGAANN